MMIPKSNRRSFKCNQCGIVNIEDIQSDESHVRLTRRGRGVTAAAGRLTEVTSNATAATAASATSWIEGLQQMETARWNFHTLHQNTSEDKAFLLGTVALKDCRLPYRGSFDIESSILLVSFPQILFHMSTCSFAHLAS